MNEIERLREKLINLEKEIKNLRDEIFITEKTCTHNWGEIIYDPFDTIDTDNYLSGIIGYKPHVYNYNKMKDRWKRICDVCGKVEYTTECNIKTTKSPKFLGETNEVH